jgi:hypothetical protein
VKIYETLVHLHLVLVPGLGTLAARLSHEIIDQTNGNQINRLHKSQGTHSFAGSDAENLGGETDGALHAEITVTTTSNEVVGD